MKSRIINLIMGLCTLALCACGDGMSTKSLALPSELLDDGGINQAAKINCNLYRNNETIPFRHISTITGMDTFIENAKEGDFIRFDCSGTEDESPVGELQFFLDEDYDPNAPNFVQVNGQTFNLHTAVAGRTPMALKVIDPLNKERIKVFTMVVECLDAQSPVLDVSQISISPTSRLNYFNFSVPSGAVSGGSNFQFAWDFNGDYVFDPISLDNPNEIWTSSATLTDVYSAFVTEGNATRQLSVKVKNGCEKESTYTINASLISDNIARNASSIAVEKPYYYLQADILSNGADSSNQRKNGDLLATQYPQDTDLRRIECDYKKTRTNAPAVFSMKALNRYKDDVEFRHGMEILINNINDNTSSGLQTFTDANMATSKYQASAADDGVVRETYDKQSGCSVTIRVRRAAPVAPCSADEQTRADFTETGAIIITGEFSCPNLVNASNQQSVRAENGKFFCEVGPINQCVGGGGGGGGTPPPEQ